MQYKSTVASLVGRAKTIIQLKPRNPDCPLKTSIPIKAICDYRQIEVPKLLETDQLLALFVYLKSELILLTSKVFHLKKKRTIEKNPEIGYGKKDQSALISWLFCSSF